MNDQPLPPGAPGSRTHYTVTITAREKEACERYDQLAMGVGDSALIADVVRKIAQLPKIVVDSPPPADQ